MTNLQLFTGSASIDLAEKISAMLSTPIGKARIGRFKDTEADIEILTEVRHKDIYLIQSTCAPVDENYMELCLIADALRRAAVNSITAVIPYMGYARQDRRITSAKVPISARVVADMLQNVGIARIITLELHSDQVQGFFNIPVDNIFSTDLFVGDFNVKKLDQVTVVSPDVGGMMRARAFAKRLSNPALAVIEKKRNDQGIAAALQVIGDVSDRNCVIIDDMVDTGSTLVAAAEALRKAGAKSVIAYVSHAVLSGDAIAAIANSTLDELVVTDSIPLTSQAKSCKKIRQISIAALLTNAIVDREV